MGMLDKAKALVTQNRDKIDKGLAKAGDMANRKTGGKHESKISTGLGRARDGLDKVAGTPGAPPPGAPPPAAPPPGPSGTPGGP